MHPLPFLLSAAIVGGALGLSLKWWAGAAHRSTPAASETPGAPRPPRVQRGSLSAPSPGAPQPSPSLSRPRPSLEDLMAADPGGRLGILIRWLPEATAEEVSALAHAWFAGSIDSGSSEWHLVALRWTEVDSAAAAAFGRAYTDRFLRTMGNWEVSGHSMQTPLHAVYRAWARRDPEAALAALALEPAKYRRHLAVGLGTLVDESRARAWALAHPDLHEFAGWRADKSATTPPDLSNPAKAAAELGPNAPSFQAANIAQEWMKTDPEAALAWARGLTDPKQRRHALQSVMNGFLATDPARARPLIDEMPAGLDRAHVEARYVAGLAAIDPEAAMRRATESLQGTAQLEAIAGIAAAKAKTDPLAALRMLRDHGIGDFGVGALTSIRVEGPHTSMGGGSGGGAIQNVLTAAAALDPAGVLQLLADTGTLRPGNRDGSFGRDSTLGHTIFSEWAARDTNAAAHWLAQQGDSAGITSLALVTADRWPAQDIAGLQSLATRFAPGEARDTLVTEAARRLATADPAGALGWAAQTGSDSAYSATFRHVAEADPQGAVSLYAEIMTPAQQETQRQALTDQLAQRSATDAIAFFQSLPPEAQAGMKLTDTSRAFARQDPQAASEWIAALPPTAAKDTAISGLVDYLISDAAEPDPVAAAHWAAASINPDGRDRRLKRVAQAWFKRDPDGTRAAIASSSLPRDVQNTLLQHAPPPR